MLFDTYIRSVHWFMMVVYESSLRAELAEMLRSGRAHRGQKCVLYLIAVILAIGAGYARDESEVHVDGQGHGHGKGHPHDKLPDVDVNIDLTKLQSRLIQTVEANFLDMIDVASVASVQTCILLSSFYLYSHRPKPKPKRCFIINGAALRAAQVLGLHRESTWGAISTVEREVRRRVWWALYVCDGFMALTFGSCSCIQDNSFAVQMPRNIDDTSDPCPGFESVENEQFEDGTCDRVTTLTYHRLKFKLYRIGSSITRDVYFHESRTRRSMAERVKKAHRALLEWEESVPLELRPSTFLGRDGDRGRGRDRPGVSEAESESDLDARASRSTTTTTIFRLQALSLQLSYDSIQVSLHKPLLVYSKIPGVPVRDGETYLPAGVGMGVEVGVEVEAEGQHIDLEESRDQCLRSAMRTSRMDEYPATLRQARNTHVAGYIAIQGFGAGVMLVIFALSQPLSAAAQEAKQGLGRLIKLPNHFGCSTAILEQSGRILEKLLRVILAQELRLLTTADEGREVDIPLRRFSRARAATVTQGGIPAAAVTQGAGGAAAITQRAGSGLVTNANATSARAMAMTVASGTTTTANVSAPLTSTSTSTIGAATHAAFPPESCLHSLHDDLNFDFGPSSTSTFPQPCSHDWEGVSLHNHSHNHSHSQQPTSTGTGTGTGTGVSDYWTWSRTRTPSQYDTFHGGSILGLLEDPGQSWLWDDSFVT
ncbi:hypothetical protein A1O3_03794 [Capronia epimyces CBS 606.96]|uniref:Xylanolytic transcriptional activator regulatory domain-containing protein n=1 Tax=Capronia epimyces CBS 606.96 TaxID=1182542 RepID=W9YB42_9EURO|nr:uncharacterized protein A1O3_03794 [Capronia epimyces CBS 606.96]EXJ86840.1 hypothetical protein A1O3_03794 [Capronia epimyces CBS 606.96]